ncbi:MAG: nucleotide exchange factor GrpE, partial [Candidatus Thermochlorobacter sp.]
MPEEIKQDELKQDNISLQEQQEQPEQSEQQLQPETLTTAKADDTSAAPDQTKTPSLEARLAALEAERDEYKDLLLRKAAEFENFRRQKEREMAALIKFADKNLIKQILPILDDLERIITNSEKFLANHPDAKLYVDGVKLVQGDPSAFCYHTRGPVRQLRVGAGDVGRLDRLGGRGPSGRPAGTAQPPGQRHPPRLKSPPARGSCSLPRRPLRQTMPLHTPFPPPPHPDPAPLPSCPVTPLQPPASPRRVPAPASVHPATPVRPPPPAPR